MWCTLGDEVADAIAARCGDRAPIEWKATLINDGRPMADTGPEQEAWYYDRCAYVTGRRFNHRWLEKKGQDTRWPNRVIAAAWKRGGGRRALEALKAAGIGRGEPILRREVAVAVAAEATGLASRELDAALDDPALAAELEANLKEFGSYRVDQRPAFVLRSRIGDTAVFSGLYRPEPVLAALEAMISDEDKYAAHAAGFPPIPR